MKAWLTNLNKHKVLLISLLFIGAFLRLFAFEESIEFNSDFGRDSLFAMRILDEKPTLLGAQASVGGFYLGPLYFYAIAAIFWFFGYIPQIVSLFFIALNILASWLIYHWLAEKVSVRAGLLGLGLFTFNSLLVYAARGATHVPMLPIITVVSMMALYQALVSKKAGWHILSGLAFGLFFHVHFTALLIIPGYFLAVLWWGGKNWRERFIALSFHGLGMVVMLLPLILFDLRHGLITSRAFLDYLMASAAGEEITVNFAHWTLAEKIAHLGLIFSNQLWLQLLLLVTAGIGLVKTWQQQLLKLTVPNLLGLMFLSMCLFYFLYSGYLYSYYLIIPVTLGILLVAVGLAAFPKPMLSAALVAVIGLFSLGHIKTMYRPIFRTTTVLANITHEIERHIDETQPDSFTIFKDSADGITGLAYEYRFLLQRDGYIPTKELEYPLAEVMYVIQEDGTSDPLTLGNWEVTQFAPTTVEKIATLELRGKPVTIFALYR